MRFVIFILLISTYFQAFSQELDKKYNMFAVAQFAGSTGLFSAGAGIQFARKKLEGSLLYGYLPEKSGGPIHTVTMKFLYDPFRKDLSEDIVWQPLQTGLFIAQHFGYNLTTRWDSRYPRGYYWWPRNARQHIFIGTTISLNHKTKYLQKSSLYLEANTNDLYMMSYFPNMKAIWVWDIFFLGAGYKLYFR